MRFFKDALTQADTNYELSSDEEDEDENQMVDVPSLSFDEFDVAIGRLVRDCILDYKESVAVTPNAIKLLAQVSSDLLAEAFRNTRSLDVTAGMLKTEALKLLFPEEQRCIAEEKLLEKLNTPPTSATISDVEVPVVFESNQDF
jgi:hypothetical protein